jgi:hypothetical protein
LGKWVLPPVKTKTTNKMEKVLTGEEIFSITNTGIKREYQNTKPGSPLEGKSYLIFAAGKDAFIVREDHDFIADLKSGNVKKVTLEVNEENKFSLLNYLNAAQKRSLREDELADVRQEAAIAGIRLMATKVTSEADVDALLKGL